MFWRVAGLATTSPVETVLDKESFTLENLLDEDDLIQEVKSMNGRLVSYLRNRPQVEQLLKYVVEEPPPDADDKRLFKYPFVSCEVFTCEIDAIFNTLLESEELMDLLFSFASPDRPHGALLSGYFCKVVICLLVRRTHDVMRYLQNHRDYLKKLVDLIGITSIMEVVMRLVGADEQILMFHADAVQWLADTDLLEMLVEKLDPQQSPDVHTNTADTLSAVARTAPSALASQLASPDYISKLFKHVLSSPQSKSSLINALSVCITLLDPKRISAAAAAGQARGIQNLQPGTGGLIAAAPETVDGMLQQLGDLLKLLAVKGDEHVLPTTYGQLSPPLGIHRLKIVEFIAVLVRTGSVPAAEELMRLMAINTVLDLFFDFPFNNLVHHQVESIVNSCLEDSNPALLDHLLKDCKLVSRILSADADPHAPDTTPTGTPKTSSRGPSRAGYMGHLTRMANKLIALSPTNDAIRGALEGEAGWNEWHQNVLQKRNSVENVFQWSCGRPTAVEERTSEPVTDGESEFMDPQRDFDLPQGSMANNIGRDRFSNRYGVFDGEVEEQDVFFDDETAEVVISSLHLGGDDSSDEDEGEATSSKRSPEGAEVIDSDSDEEEVSPKVPRGGFRFPKPTALEVEGAGESSGGGGSDDEVVLGDEDMLPGSPTAPVDLSEAAAAAAAGKLGTAGVIAEGSGKLSEAALAKEATQDVDLFGDASPFRATQPANPPAAPAPKNFFAPAGSPPGGFADFNSFAADFAANFSDSPVPASSPTPSKPPSRGFGSPESFGSPDSFEPPNHSFPAFPINPARNIDLFADETPFTVGGPSAFSAVPPKPAHEKAEPLDTNLFASAGGDVGVSQGPPLNDLFAKGGPPSPPVDLFAAAQATPHAEEAHSAMQQGTATEIGWFKDDASRAPEGSETPGSDTPEEGRFSSDSLEKPSKEGSENAEPEGRGLYSADSLDTATEGGLEKVDSEEGVREMSESGGEMTVEQPKGKVGKEHDSHETDKHAKLEEDTSELGHGKGPKEGLKDDASPELTSEKDVKPESRGALGGLAALGAAAVGGVGAIGASLGHAFSKQDSDEKPAEAIESESRMEAVDKHQRSLEAPSTSLQTPAHGAHAPTNVIGAGEATGGKLGAEESASAKQNHVGPAEKSEFNDVNFWKSSYGMSIDEDAL